MGHYGQYEPVRAVNRKTRCFVVQKPKDKRPQRRLSVDHDQEEHALLKIPIEYTNFKARCKPGNLNATPRRPSTPADSHAAQTSSEAGNDTAQPLAFNILAGYNGGGDDQDNDPLEVNVDPHREPVDAHGGAGLGEARSHHGRSHHGGSHHGGSHHEGIAAAAPQTVPDEHQQPPPQWEQWAPERGLVPPNAPTPPNAAEPHYASVPLHPPAPHPMPTEHGNDRYLYGGSRVYPKVDPQHRRPTRSSQINHRDQSRAEDYERRSKPSYPASEVGPSGFVSEIGRRGKSRPPASMETRSGHSTVQGHTRDGHQRIRREDRSYHSGQEFVSEQHSPMQHQNPSQSRRALRSESTLRWFAGRRIPERWEPMHDERQSRRGGHEPTSSASGYSTASSTARSRLEGFPDRTSSLTGSTLTKSQLSLTSGSASTQHHRERRGRDRSSARDHERRAHCR